VYIATQIIENMSADLTFGLYDRPLVQLNNSAPSGVDQFTSNLHLESVIFKNTGEGSTLLSSYHSALIDKVSKETVPKLVICSRLEHHVSFKSIAGALASLLCSSPERTQISHNRTTDRQLRSAIS
jgi:hypothetical protein